jgi:hypothetical protein
MSADIAVAAPLPPFIGEYFRELLFAALFVALVAGWFFLKRIPGRVRSAMGGNWPSAEGRVETVNVTAFGSQALAELGYSYLVQGVRYSGYCSLQFADEQQAWDYLKGLQGQPIAVRYMHRKPQVSALRNADQQSHVNLGGGSLPTTFLAALSNFVRESFSPRRS